MKTTDDYDFAGEEIAQHSASGEGILQVQFVDPAHQSEICDGDRAWQRVDAAAADAEFTSLRSERQVVGPVDHRFALANSPALSSATSKKSLASVSSAIFA